MLALDFLVISMRIKESFSYSYGFVDRIILDIMLVAMILATIVIFIYFPWI